MSETDQKLKAAREAVLLEDNKKTLDFTRRLAEAGQKAMGLDLGTSDGDEMIVGDVTINTTTDTKQAASGLPKWAAAALALAGLGTGIGAIPAAGVVLNYLTKTTNVAPPVERDRNGIGIFRPAKVETSVPVRSDGITVVSATWCGPCGTYKSNVLNRLIAEGYAVKVVINDSPKHPVPMTHFFLDGKVVDRQAGVIDYNTLKKALTK